MHNFTFFPWFINVCFLIKIVSNTCQKSGLPTVPVIEGDMEIQRAWETGSGPTAGEACGWDRSPGLCPSHSHTNSYSPGHRWAQQPHVTEERDWRPRAFSLQRHAGNQWDLPLKKKLWQSTHNKKVYYFNHFTVGNSGALSTVPKLCSQHYSLVPTYFITPKETLDSVRSLSLLHAALSSS